jgi:hypothetical protein
MPLLNGRDPTGSAKWRIGLPVSMTRQVVYLADFDRAVLFR